MVLRNKIIHFSIFFFLSLSLHCQIVLEDSDLPLPGDVQTSSRIDSVQGLTLSPGSSGPNVTWDFGIYDFWGGSMESSFDSVRWVSPEPDNTFPLAYIAQKNHCYLYHDWTTHTISEQCFLDYYIKDSTGLNYYASSFPQANILDGFRTIFPLLSYGQTKINQSRIVIQKSLDSVLVTHIKDTIIADGWGTLVTFIDNYNAIRIYTKETVWDSLYVNGTGELINHMPQNYYYKWYIKDLGFPVMQINKGIMEIRSDYQIARFAFDKRNDAGIIDVIKEKNNLKVIPNPFHNEAKIVIKNYKKDINISVIVYDLTGRQVMQIKNIHTDEISIKRNNLPNGMYSYKIIGDDTFRGMGKFIVY